MEMNLHLLLLAAIILIPTTIANPNLDGQILLNFASSVPHGRKLNWNLSNPICSSWVGIKCNQNQTRISSIRLPAIGLHGPIPLNTLGKLDALKTLSLRSNLLNGNLPSDLLSLPSLNFLYLQQNNFSGHITFTLSSSRLAVLDLSFNSLTGHIPKTIQNLSNLYGLFLQHNSISGQVPDLVRVKHLNLSHNRFNGSIPSSLKNFPKSSFEGNPTLCGPPLNPCANPINHKHDSHKKLSTLGIIILAAVGFCVGLILLMVWWCTRKRKEGGNVVRGNNKKGLEKKKKEEEFGSGVQEAEKNKLVFFQGFSYSFDLEDLLRASAEVLGKGSYGTAYKAVLEEGTTVVVKRLKEVVVGRKEFEEQMEVVGRMGMHPNVLPLRAYYYSKDEKLLVCDYVIMGSLSSLLHGNNRDDETGNPNLNWDARYKIIVGTAHGLAHLHASNLIHGNIKASNILLTQTLDPRVSDFGLTPLMNPPSLTPSRAAAGYRAPEAIETRKNTLKSDVYSFGVLLLEMLTGKAPAQSPGHGREDDVADLPRWVQSVVREEWTAEVFDVVLMRGGGESDEEELMGMLQIAMACVGKVADMRPGIGDVVGMIEEIKHQSAKGEQTP